MDDSNSRSPDLNSSDEQRTSNPSFEDSLCLVRAQLVVFNELQIQAVREQPGGIDYLHLLVPPPSIPSETSHADEQDEDRSRATDSTNTRNENVQRSETPSVLAIVAPPRLFPVASHAQPNVETALAAPSSSLPHSSVQLSSNHSPFLPSQVLTQSCICPVSSSTNPSNSTHTAVIPATSRATYNSFNQLVSQYFHTVPSTFSQRQLQSIFSYNLHLTQQFTRHNSAQLLYFRAPHSTVQPQTSPNCQHLTFQHTPFSQGATLSSPFPQQPFSQLLPFPFDILKHFHTHFHTQLESSTNGQALLFHRVHSQLQLEPQPHLPSDQYIAENVAITRPSPNTFTPSLSETALSSSDLLGRIPSAANFETEVLDVSTLQFTRTIHSVAVEPKPRVQSYLSLETQDPLPPKESISESSSSSTTKTSENLQTHPRSLPCEPKPSSTPPFQTRTYYRSMTREKELRAPAALWVSDKPERSATGKQHPHMPAFSHAAYAASSHSRGHSSYLATQGVHSTPGITSVSLQFGFQKRTNYPTNRNARLAALQKSSKKAKPVISVDEVTVAKLATELEKSWVRNAENLYPYHVYFPAKSPVHGKSPGNDSQLEEGGPIGVSVVSLDEKLESYDSIVTIKRLKPSEATHDVKSEPYCFGETSDDEEYIIGSNGKLERLNEK